MIDTRAIRANAGSALKFRGEMSDCAPWLNIRLEIVAKDAMLSADEIDALRAALAAAEARAERLADAADNVLMQVIPQGANTYSISACELEPLRAALKPYTPGDMGGALDGEGAK